MSTSRALLLTLIGAGLALWFFWLRDVAGARSARAPAAAVAAHSEAEAREAQLSEPESPESREVPAARTELAPGGVTSAQDELGADEGVLQVRVLALEDDRPLGGVPVRVETPAGEIVSGVHPIGRLGAQTDARTDRTGKLDCAVPAGRELVLHANPEVEAGGASALFRVRPLEPGCTLTVVIGLVRVHAGDWYGRIVDGATLAPVADARLRLVRAFTAAETRCAADGRVHVALASGAGFTLSVEAPGFAPCSLTLAGHEDRAHEELVRLLRTATLEVEVHDQAGRARAGLELVLSGAAVPGAERVHFALNPAPELRATTDDNGRCTLAGIFPHRAASLTAEDGERRVLAAAIRPLESGERRVVTLELGPLVELLGTLRDPAGAALGGRRLQLALRVPSGSAAPDPSEWATASPARVAFATAMTDAEGRFFFGLIPAGEWVVTLVAEPELNSLFEGSADEPTGSAQVMEELSLRGDEARRELELTVRPQPASSGSRSTVLRLPAIRVLTR